jgi:hypothetical protein
MFIVKLLKLSHPHHNLRKKFCENSCRKFYKDCDIEIMTSTEVVSTHKLCTRTRAIALYTV